MTIETNSVSVTATQNAVPRELVGVATAGSTLFRQIGGSIGVSVFGAIFSSGLASQLGDAVPSGGGGFNAQSIQALPEAMRIQVVEGFATALHPVFLTAAGAAVIAFGLTFLLKEIPLATTLRKEPEAEIEAEENATAAAVGA